MTAVVRPEGVPEDWILVDCMNPDCDYTVWVADLGPLSAVPVVNVCSSRCATVYLEIAMRDPLLLGDPFPIPAPREG